jgi:hypothetical protein
MLAQAVIDGPTEAFLLLELKSTRRMSRCVAALMQRPPPTELRCRITPRAF